jgi:hypothetical protein
MREYLLAMGERPIGLEPRYGVKSGDLDTAVKRFHVVSIRVTFCKAGCKRCVIEVSELVARQALNDLSAQRR